MLLQSGSRRAADAEAAERQRAVRERLEATVSGLEELEYLRQRQEELVRSALEEQQEQQEEQQEQRREAQLSSEEKLLEENILLLRKQLNCLRRRDAGLITQLQELDRQISDLRLDTEASHDQLEMDSRPSSGFYELSDGASVSLSNSSNSVFSECFCSVAEADGRFLSADEPPGCLECDGLLGSLCDDSSSSAAAVRRSLSAPQPPSLDPVASCDSQSKYHCDLVARNGSDVYRYPSPLHAVAVQSPGFLQVLGHGGPGRDDGLLRSLEGGEGLRAEPPPLVSQSSSWTAPSSSSSQTPSHKRLDGYIYSLLQRRALPVRTSRPRTSISTDPSKSVLRQASLCMRPGTLRASEPKPSRSTGGAPAEGAASSPQRKWSVEGKPEQEEVFPDGDTMQDGFKMNHSALAQNQKSSPLRNVSNTNTDGPLKQKRATLQKDLTEPGGPREKETKQTCYFPDQEVLLKSPPVIKTPPKKPEKVVRSVPEISVCSSSQSPDKAGAEGAEGAGSHLLHAKHIPSQRQNGKLRKSGSKVKPSRSSEPNEPPSERRGDRRHHGSKRSRLLEDGGSVRGSRRTSGSSSRIKRLPASIPEGRVLDKHTSTLGSVRSGASRHHHHGNHHHHHGRDQVVVVAKPKHKRSDYRRLRAIMEVPYDEAFRRAQRRQRKELLSHPAAGACSPYSYVQAGSDSEYSAECASLFHSTIVDTSEDERSNYTTNRFGDSESSEEEYVEESASDTEESGGGGACGEGGGRGWSQSAGVRGAGQGMTPAQAKAFVKIKASHNLKKKILRFRSGSLKLMTTV